VQLARRAIHTCRCTVAAARVRRASAASVCPASGGLGRLQGCSERRNCTLGEVSFPGRDHEGPVLRGRNQGRIYGIASGGACTAVVPAENPPFGKLRRPADTRSRSLRERFLSAEILLSSTEFFSHYRVAYARETGGTEPQGTAERNYRGQAGSPAGECGVRAVVGRRRLSSTGRAGRVLARRGE
jgi:hypothetical protein